LERKIGGNLYEQRRSEWDGFACPLLDGAQDLIQRGPFLKLAQARRVRRTDVDDKEIPMWPQDSKRLGVIFRRALQESDFRFSKVDPDRMSGPAAATSPLVQDFRESF